jgi:hypothetical protein
METIPFSTSHKSNYLQLVQNFLNLIRMPALARDNGLDERRSRHDVAVRRALLRVLRIHLDGEEVERLLEEVPPMQA